jgi:hypothetical protein
MAATWGANAHRKESVVLRFAAATSPADRSAYAKTFGGLVRAG